MKVHEIVSIVFVLLGYVVGVIQMLSTTFNTLWGMGFIMPDYLTHFVIHSQICLQDLQLCSL